MNSNASFFISLAETPMRRSIPRRKILLVDDDSSKFSFQLPKKRFSSSSFSTLSSFSSLSSQSLETVVEESTTDKLNKSNQRWSVNECGGRDKPVRAPSNQRWLVHECGGRDKPVRVPRRSKFSQHRR